MRSLTWRTVWLASGAIAFADAMSPQLARGDHPAGAANGTSAALIAEMTALAAVTFAVAVYARGLLRLRRTAAWDGRRGWAAGAFASGGVVLAIALSPPLHAASDVRFSAHMVQHVLLLVVAAPLLVLGRPLIVWLWALPRWARMRAAAIVRARSTHFVWRGMAHPVTAWTLHAATLWTWHLPALYERSLHSEVLHAMQHGCLVGTALLFWWSVVGMAPQRYGIGVLSLFATTVHSGALGALITFAPAPWYASYARARGAFGLTPLEDQQLAGLVMWVPCGAVFTVAGLVLFAAWLRASDRRRTSSR